MIYLVAILLFGGIIALIANHLQRHSSTDNIVDVAPSCDNCSGSDERCMSDCMLEAAVKKPEYFDDEELDAYSGRRDDDYSDSEIEQFREIMLTMQPSEVADWTRSLSLRGVSLPRDLRDEAIMLINDSH